MTVKLDDSSADLSFSTRPHRRRHLPGRGHRIWSVRLYNETCQAAAAVQIATHRTIIVDPRVHAQSPSSPTPVTPEAFYQAFRDVLQTVDLCAAMSVGPTANLIRILPKE